MPRAQHRFYGLFLPRNSTIWWTRRVIPMRVRAMFGGKTQFCQSTHQTDQEEAWRVSKPWQAGWDRQIKAAQAALGDPIKEQVERLAAEWRDARGKADDDAEAIVATDAITFVFERLGGYSATQTAAALAAARGRALTAMGRLPDAVRASAQDTFGYFSGSNPVPVEATPFMQHFDAWLRSGEVRDAHGKNQRINVQHFARDNPNATLEGVNKVSVQLWVRDLQAGNHGKPLRATTIQRKLIALGNYYKWLAGGGIIPADHTPFSRVTVRELKSEAELEDAKRQRFTLPEIAKLIAGAGDDVEMVRLIRFCYLTGARRESVCALRVSNVMTDDETGIRFFRMSGKGSKTASGVRNVPVHPDLISDLDAMIADADKDGFLFHDGKLDRFKCRGGRLGARFTRLRDKCGFDRQKYVLHCLRKSFTYELGKTGVPEGVIDRLCGWANKDMRDHYAGDDELSTKYEAIRRLPSIPTV